VDPFLNTVTGTMTQSNNLTGDFITFEVISVSF